MADAPAVQPLLAAALAEAHPVDHPPGPLHGGGLPPVLRAAEQIRVIVWCAEKHSRGEERFEETLALVRRGLSFAPELGAVPPELLEGLAERGRRPREPEEASSPASLAGLAARATSRLLARERRGISRCARLAVTRALRLLTGAAWDPEGRGRGGAHVTLFLQQLDEELLLQEALGHARRLGVHRLEARRPRLAHRAADLHGRRGAVWLLELEPHFGVVVRLGGHLHWTEGSLDDVLATLPEPHFAQTIAALFGT